MALTFFCLTFCWYVMNHEIIGSSYPVSAEYTPDGWQSHGIAFEDYARMHTQQRLQSAERRLPTPRWAIDNAMLKELLVRFQEIRAWERRRKGEGTLEERLASATAWIESRRPRLIATLEDLCRSYVENEDHARKKMLAINIEGIDTFLRYTKNQAGLATVAAIVSLYYRVGLDSVGVAQELGLKPTHVRQTLWRLFRVAENLAGSNPAFADSAKEIDEARMVARAARKFNRKRPSRWIKRVRPAKVYVFEYRNAPVDILETNGSLARIKNQKGEILTVERKAINRSIA